MKLVIQFKKEIGKATILHCLREDGSVTFNKLYPNLEIHDIAHYVVEKHLSYQYAFYGLLARGYSILDFELPKDQIPNALLPKNLQPQAIITEHLVNLLQIWYSQPKKDLDIIKNLQTVLEEKKLVYPAQLTSELIRSIEKELIVYMLQWEQLPNHEALEFIFNCDA